MNRQPWVHNNLTVLAWRLFIPLAALLVLRWIFYAFNTDMLGTLHGADLPGILQGGWKFDLANICYCYCLFVAFSFFPFRVREKRWYSRMLFWMWMIPGGLIVLINLADVVYFRNARKRFTIDELHFTGNDNTGHIVLKAMGEYWYLLPAGAVLLWGMYRLFRSVKPAPMRIRNPWVFAGVNLMMIPVSAILLIGGMRGGLQKGIRPLAMVHAVQYVRTPAAAPLVQTNPFCILRTMTNKKLLRVNYFRSSEEAAKYYSPYHYPHRPDTTGGKPHRYFGSQRGKNILIFVLESFSFEHSAYANPELYPDGVAYTPFLDSLMREGYLFRRGYSNGRKSIDALPSILSSIPSFKSPFLTMPQSLGPTRGLGTLLKEENYSTWFFSGSERGSMGAVGYARLAGCDRARTREDYFERFGRINEDNYWGVWDAPFFRYMASELDQAPKPFFSTIFTLSSHHPFVVPAEYENRLPEGKTRIHRPVAYTDQGLREFFDYAGKQPWYENTVFVFTADHVSSELYGPAAATPTGNMHITFFMYTPDGSLRGDDPYVAQQIDLMPTLLGLTGYGKPYFAFGQDVFEIREDSTTVREKAFAINYINEMIQWITDSTAMLFDDRQVKYMYNLKRDPLEMDNLTERGMQPDSAQVLRMKALIQSYYEHVENAEYLVR